MQKPKQRQLEIERRDDLKHVQLLYPRFRQMPSYRESTPMGVCVKKGHGAFGRWHCVGRRQLACLSQKCCQIKLSQLAFLVLMYTIAAASCGSCLRRPKSLQLLKNQVAHYTSSAIFFFMRLQTNNKSFVVMHDRRNHCFSSRTTLVTRKSLFQSSCGYSDSTASLCSRA